MALIPFVKKAFVTYLRYLAAEPKSREEYGWRRKVRKYLGRHERGKDLKGGYQRDYLRYVLTALITSRCFEVPGVVEPSSIQDPCTGKVHR
jgi:hypothetical protein